MRAAKYKHLAENSSAKRFSLNVKNGKKHSVLVKLLSFVTVFALTAIVLIIPTTTLAPNVDAIEDKKSLSYSIGSIDVFDEFVVENCVSMTAAPTTEMTTQLVTEKVAETTEETTQAKTEPTETVTEKKIKETQPKTEPVTEKVTEPVEKATQKPTTPVVSNKKEDKTESVNKTDSKYLIEISNPDSSYSPKKLKLSEYDRAKLERLVMGEAGTMGYKGCALVAQAIRDAMNRSNTSSIDKIIKDYKYVGSTSIEPSQTVKDAVSFIFDENRSAVQHRVLCFYTGTSKWHETQEFIVGCGSVRFFDMID